MEESLAGNQRSKEILSQEAVDQLYQVTGIGTWDWNLLTGQLQWSAPMEALYGFTPGTFDQSLSMFIDCLHPDDQFGISQALETAISTRVVYEVKFRIVVRNQPIRWILSKGQVFYNMDDQPSRIIGIDFDITEYKQTEIALSEAQRANQVKDEFLAILSHELRSPLNPILGWTKMLQSGKLDTARVTEALAVIERNAKWQSQLIDDLLDMARILRGKLSLNLTPVNLRSVMESAIEAVTTAATAKSLSLQCALMDVGQISGDIVRLHQIVWNLLSNAVKFTPDGGCIEIQLEHIGNTAQLTIQDTGKGIQADFLPHIFQSFFQEDVSIARNYGGLGLGLAIVYQLVEAHGGRITAESLGKDQGATFTVLFPLLNQQIEETQLKPFQKRELDLSEVRVLVIDDEPDCREVLSFIITQSGGTVMQVATAAEFLAALGSFQPHVIVSDIGMPEVDGFMLLRQVRSRPLDHGGQVPAIALTAYAGELNQVEALAAGFQRHLSKPIDPDFLIAAIVALLKTDQGSIEPI
jgi:signal transduction histidine kinase/ActR/RegA family two-component response regulator